MKVIAILLWVNFIPDQGIRYHHLGTFDNKTLCMAQLKYASVMVNDKSETLECIQIEVER